MRKSTTQLTYKSTYSRFSCLAGHYKAVQHWSVEPCKTLDSVCRLSFEGALSDLKVWYGVMPLDSWTVREKHSSEQRLQQLEIMFTSLYSMPGSEDMQLVLYLLKEWAKKNEMNLKRTRIAEQSSRHWAPSGQPCSKQSILPLPSLVLFSGLITVRAPLRVMLSLHAQ